MYVLQPGGISLFYAIGTGWYLAQESDDVSLDIALLTTSFKYLVKPVSFLETQCLSTSERSWEGMWAQAPESTC